MPPKIELPKYVIPDTPRRRRLQKRYREVVEYGKRKNPLLMKQ